MVFTAKNFTFEGKNAVKIGTVELYEDELVQARRNGKYYILTRTCCYYILGKKAQADNDGRTEYYYRKLETTGKENTLPHRFFILGLEEISPYLKPGNFTNNKEK